MEAPQPQEHDQAKRFFHLAMAIIIALGLLLRAAKYLPAFSMRGDELAVTLNLVNRSTIDLMTKPLDYEQAAPVGFVLVMKALITVAGQSEYVLRLVAFLAGCISLFLMHRLLTKTVGRAGSLFALLAFALGSSLIYYSSELKQYSTDVLFTLVLLLAFHRHLSGGNAGKDWLMLAGLGGVALCFSYPALFVIAAIGLTLLLHHWSEKKQRRRVILTGILWAGIFLALYLALLRHQTQDTYLITFWDNLLSFMPMPPWRELSWFPKAAEGLFFVVAGLSSSLILIVPLYLLGIWGFWRAGNWQWALVLTIPMGLNLLVSGFEKYPFHGRLLLYLLPLIFMVLGKGMDVLVEGMPNRLLARTVFAALLLWLLSPAVPTVNSYLIARDYLQDDLKPVLSFVNANKQDTDLIYVYHYLEEPYAFYADAYHLEGLPVVIGQNHSGDAAKYREELSSLPRGQRIWFLFSFVHEARVRQGVKRDERKYILNYLEESGTLLEETYSRNNASSAHLFVLK